MWLLMVLGSTLHGSSHDDVCAQVREKCFGAKVPLSAVHFPFSHTVCCGLPKEASHWLSRSLRNTFYRRLTCWKSEVDCLLVYFLFTLTGQSRWASPSRVQVFTLGLERCVDILFDCAKLSWLQISEVKSVQGHQIDTLRPRGQRLILPVCQCTEWSAPRAGNKVY